VTQIIAEIGLAHEGSLNHAHAMLDAAANAGAAGVKFQIHHAYEGTADETFRRPWSRYAETRQQYWARTAFLPHEWAALREYASDLGVDFGASVFSLESAELLHRLEPDFWKVSAGMVAHGPLLDYLGAHRGDRPVYVSAGLADTEALETAMQTLGPGGVVLHCVSEYPTPHDRAAWSRRHALRVLAYDYGWTLGLSDHSGTIWPGLLACAERDTVVECHVCFDRAQGGPDAPASLTFAELSTLCNGAATLHTLQTASGEWARPAHAASYEPCWVQEGGRWVVRKTNGKGIPASQPCPGEAA
jgi:N-acetylneuraminate synthase